MLTMKTRKSAIPEIIENDWDPVEAVGVIIRVLRKEERRTKNPTRNKKKRTDRPGSGPILDQNDAG